MAETARRLGILVVADEVYSHLTFGSAPFVPMGAFGSVVPVLTLGSLSKRWVVPGWRLGWIVTTDPNGVLKQTKVSVGIQFHMWPSFHLAGLHQGKLRFHNLQWAAPALIQIELKIVLACRTHLHVCESLWVTRPGLDGLGNGVQVGPTIHFNSLLLFFLIHRGLELLHPYSDTPKF